MKFHDFRSLQSGIELIRLCTQTNPFKYKWSRDLLQQTRFCTKFLLNDQRSVLITWTLGPSGRDRRCLSIVAECSDALRFEPSSSGFFILIRLVRVRASESGRPRRHGAGLGGLTGDVVVRAADAPACRFDQHLRSFLCGIPPQASWGQKGGHARDTMRMVRGFVQNRKWGAKRRKCEQKLRINQAVN